jgi:hypothetical protein
VNVPSVSPKVNLLISAIESRGQKALAV